MKKPMELSILRLALCFVASGSAKNLQAIRHCLSISPAAACAIKFVGTQALALKAGQTPCSMHATVSRQEASSITGRRENTHSTETAGLSFCAGTLVSITVSLLQQGAHLRGFDHCWNVLALMLLQDIHVGLLCAGGDGSVWMLKHTHRIYTSNNCFKAA